jgi:hypothetical protein
MLLVSGCFLGAFPFTAPNINFYMVLYFTSSFATSPLFHRPLINDIVKKESFGKVNAISAISLNLGILLSY